MSLMFLGWLSLALALGSLGVVGYILFFPKQESNIRALMGRAEKGLAVPSEIRERIQNDASGMEYEALKEASKTKLKQTKDKLSLEDRFFRAGVFTPEDKRDFARMRVIVPCVTIPLVAVCCGYLGAEFIIVGAVLGGLIGMQLPFTMLDRQMKKRDEDIMFYLPLVIEQIAIGVSSSLDIGPCLQRVVMMADERDSHNVVTELIRHAHYFVKSGASLEEALNEVGKKSGHTELKHAFLSLSQVAKHGGEITRQLQELADAVGAQRETRIEGVIKKLELKATFPVTLVFLGFIIILLIGFGIQIKGAF